MYNKEHYNKNKEKYKEATKKYYHKDKTAFYKAHNTYLSKIENRLLVSTRASSTRRKINHEITVQDIKHVLVEYCPILNVPLNFANDGYNQYNPSIDRVDSTKGYTPDNIQIISVKANRMKSNATKEELIAFANWILDTYG